MASPAVIEDASAKYTAIPPSAPPARIFLFWSFSWFLSIKSRFFVRKLNSSSLENFLFLSIIIP